MASLTSLTPTGDFPLNSGTSSRDFSTCAPAGRARHDTIGTVLTAAETENRSPPVQPELRRTRTMKASTEYTQIAAGLEPGLDPDQDIDDERTKALKGECQITVVEYSEDKLEQYELLGEDHMKDFLTKPREDWVKVRWINCDGEGCSGTRGWVLGADGCRVELGGYKGDQRGLQSASAGYDGFSGCEEGVC